VARINSKQPEEMSTPGEYVAAGEDGEVTINAAGVINAENIKRMKFTFSEGKDITEEISKKPAKNVSAIKHGRLGYTSITCTYPNKIDTSSKVVFKDCVLQYRDTITRQDSGYGKSYVCLGIPAAYINKIMADAKKNSGVTVQPKSNVQEKSGYYWFSCNVDHLEYENIWVFFSEESASNVTIIDVLTNMKSSVVCTVMVTISGSMATDKMEDELDLVRGVYAFTIKPTEIFMMKDTDIEGPVLDELHRRQKETVEKSSQFVSTGRLAEYVKRSATRN